MGKIDGTSDVKRSFTNEECSNVFNRLLGVQGPLVKELSDSKNCDHSSIDYKYQGSDVELKCKECNTTMLLISEPRN